MNFIIILTVCAVLLVYCNYSWQQIALAADLELQRAMHIQNFYRCEALLSYGKLLFQQAELTNKKKSKPKLSVLLYSGPWPLTNAKGNSEFGLLEAKFNLTKKSWVLYSTLFNQAQIASQAQIKCQISCEIVDKTEFGKSNLKFTNWQQKF